ncbi:MAG: PorT family protein [Bacteroidales bacterium]|nr:PorT family protein [Bacteroidales bacterium]
MKNKSLVLLAAVALFLFPATNFAQSSQPSEGISAGFKVGANLSNVYDSDNEDFQADSKLGFAAGAFLSLPLGRYLGIQPEILFSQKGFQGSGSILGSDYSFSRTTNYIDIPILLAIKPIGLITLLVGPQYSYLMSQKYVFKSAIVNIEQEEQFENEDIRKNTLCITGGFDVNLTNIVLSARTGWDLQNNSADGTSSTPRYKNMWYQATVGYRF